MYKMNMFDETKYACTIFHYLSLTLPHDNEVGSKVLRRPWLRLPPDAVWGWIRFLKDKEGRRKHEKPNVALEG